MDEEAYVRRIVEAISRLTGIKVKEILGPSRIGQVSRVRFTAQYLARTKTTLSFPDIGKIFGARNHATIISACNKEMMLLNRNALFRGKFPMKVWHEMVLAEVDRLTAAVKEAQMAERDMPSRSMVKTQVLENPLFHGEFDDA